ncbi:hypothetical protein [Natrialba aegyptia]|uniref:Glycosyltransferase RgtA/B/C/D-like domain-containing protein n=1 Tax=Natrialba aegyptia DSM 13077 TaxID=1227491 RepID=M0AIA3_9EURY|nr:hypothetical protein [Natrialba aegyptia]ELY97627.1 hypothetical protein C480_21809 [Natrialba aegyptia DSM 13077]
MGDRWWLGPGIGVLGALAFIVGVVTTPPAAGYEVSVYDAYPLWTWAGFALALVAGLGSLFRSVITGERGWRHGLAIVASAYGVFFALPLFRGYYIYGTPMSDALYHFGIVRDVLENGLLPETGYPATHLLYTALVTVTGLSMRELQPIVALGFFALFVGACYLAGRAFFGHRGGLATLGAALPLVFVSHHLMTLPWLFALPFLPLLLALTHRWARRRRSGHEGIFGSILICGTVLVFYHPVTALVTALALALYALIVAAPSLRRVLQRRRNRTGRRDRDHGTSAVTYRLPFIILIPGVFWYLSIGHITQFLARAVTRDIDGGAVGYAGAAQQTSYSIRELVWEFLVLEWGTVVLYAGVSAIIVAVIAIRLLRRRGSRLELLFAAQFSAGVGVALFLIASQVLSRNIVRLNNYTLVGAIFLLGLAIAGLASQRPNTDGWKRIGVTLALGGLCLTVLGTALLAGAVTYEDNSHVTHATMAGAEWQHDHHQTAPETRAFRMSENIQRYFDGLSRSTPEDRQFHRSVDAYQLPDRLGYDDADSMAAVYENETYLVTKTADIEWAADQPPDRRNEIQSYSSSDLEQATDDPSVSRLYDNGEFTVWLVEPNSSGAGSESD